MIARRKHRVVIQRGDRVFVVHAPGSHRRAGNKRRSLPPFPPAVLQSRYLASPYRARFQRNRYRAYVRERQTATRAAPMPDGAASADYNVRASSPPASPRHRGGLLSSKAPTVRPYVPTRRWWRPSCHVRSVRFAPAWRPTASTSAPPSCPIPPSRQWTGLPVSRRFCQNAPRPHLLRQPDR